MYLTERQKNAIMELIASFREANAGKPWNDGMHSVDIVVGDDHVEDGVNILYTGIASDHNLVIDRRFGKTHLKVHDGIFTFYDVIKEKADA